MINKFDKEYEFLSNFYPVTIFWKGIKFPTVEHAFVASKSLYPVFWHFIANIPAKYAGTAKRKGRDTPSRKDWEDVKLKFMEEFLRQKFSSPNLKMKLLATRDHELTEGNYWHDNFWGDCYCKKCKTVQGMNMLGKLLMKIREEMYDAEDSSNGRSS
jgi:ribA/ribD-fused uncharacterized protein